MGWEKSNVTKVLRCRENQLSPEQMEEPIKNNWLPHERINFLWMPSETVATWQQQRHSSPEHFYTTFCSQYNVWLVTWHNRQEAMLKNKPAVSVFMFSITSIQRFACQLLGRRHNCTLILFCIALSSKSACFQVQKRGEKNKTADSQYLNLIIFQAG